MDRMLKANTVKRLEAFLSFLGLGMQPPMSSWGVLIKDGADKMEEFPWLLIFPGTIISTRLAALASSRASTSSRSGWRGTASMKAMGRRRSTTCSRAWETSGNGTTW